MKNLFKNQKSIDKDYKYAKSEYSPKEYVEESLENADVSKRDIKMLKKWLRNKRKKK